MSTIEITKAAAPAAPSLSPAPAPAPFAADMLLGGAVFEPAAPAPQDPSLQPGGEPAVVPVLRLAVKGLKPVERQLLDGLVKVSQRRSPRLALLDPAIARDADVIMVDTRDAAAMAWAQERPWLAHCAVIWIDASDAGPGHTLLRRPVQWPILPMVLARALERAPGTAAGACVAAPGPTPSSTRRILVVDDNLAVRLHLRSVLEARGYRITEADGVPAAMARLEGERFDCVLMDVVMPQLDGYQGCQRIKASRRGADALPVVMLTSKGSPFDRLRGKMAGCDAYLTKPVDPQHLGEVLAQLVGAAPVRGSTVVPVRRVDPNRSR